MNYIDEILLVVLAMIMFFAWRQFYKTHKRKKHGRK